MGISTKPDQVFETPGKTENRGLVLEEVRRLAPDLFERMDEETHRGIGPLRKPCIGLTAKDPKEYEDLVRRGFLSDTAIYHGINWDKDGTIISGLKAKCLPRAEWHRGSAENLFKWSASRFHGAELILLDSTYTSRGPRLLGLVKSALGLEPKFMLVTFTKGHGDKVENQKPREFLIRTVRGAGLVLPDSAVSDVIDYPDFIYPGIDGVPQVYMLFRVK